MLPRLARRNISYISGLFVDSAARRRLDDELQNLCQQGSWVGARSLNNALSNVYEAYPDILVVECGETERMLQEGYHKRPHIVASIFDRSTILLPLHVDGNHWCLGVIRHEDRVARDVLVFDSLMRGDCIVPCRKLMNAFMSHYLPKTPLRARIAVPHATNQQPNGSDCGIYTFAVGLFVATGLDVPLELHSGLWRRIMATCLGAKIADYHTLFPETVRDEPAEQASIGEHQHLSRSDRIKAARAQMQAAETKFRRHAKKNFDQLTSFHVSLSPALGALNIVAKASTIHLLRLQDKLKEVGEMKGYGVDLGENTDDNFRSVTEDLRVFKTVDERIQRVAEDLKQLDARLEEEMKQLSENIKQEGFDEEILWD